MNYYPSKKEYVKTLVDVPSGWGDIPTILKDLIITFKIKTKTCLEFGVAYGYSLSAFSNYFENVIGVDTFIGDMNSGFKDDHFEITKNNLSKCENVHLIKSSYEDFILNNNEYYDLIHVDIVHDYENTYTCGKWASQHTDVILFHDTESYQDSVKKACKDISEEFNFKFYNYPYSHGLGILIKNQ